PSPKHLRMMGDKIEAKEAAKRLGIPVVPGSDGGVDSEADALRLAKEIGFPLIIKAASGGGGRGMKVANTIDEVVEAYNICRTEAKAAFGDDAVYMERYLGEPRHIEVQLIADGQGGCVHLWERDCSVQRRHQKVIEEAPSPALDQEAREKIGATVTSAMIEMGYASAGTIEFLYERGEFFFIEMNTRLQVEHPISEMICGVDLVREQIRVAAGEKLSFKQEDIKLNGHSIECRITAEHPETFMPSPGAISDYHAPGGLGVRVDSHLYSGYSIPPYYDSLVSKLIVHADSREECLRRLDRALGEYVIGGINTTIPLHQKLIHEDAFISGDYDIHWLEKLMGLK
ncbi:MAG: acetyl-CoA carboxylase biotin carboxylase subunit, partial [Alphaproteobacteria bacterium]|nr:acetyl-CoA carboxylase biotin carboxylase subunit [Alphaproteobacteria bacterium]